MFLKTYRNSFVLLAGEGTSAVLMATTGVMLARMLPVADFGRFMAVLALAQILGFLVDFGMGPVAARDIARGGSRRHELDQIFSWRLAMMGLACLLAPAVSKFILKGPDTASIAFWLTPAVLCLGMADFIGWILKGDKRVVAYASFLVSSRFCLLVFCLIPFLLHQRSVSYVVIAYGISGLFTLVMGGFWLTRYGLSLRPARWNDAFYRDVLPQIYALGFALILSAVFWRLDLLLVAHFCDKVQVGLFSSAGRLVDAVRLVPTALFGFYLPVFSSLHGRHDELRAQFISAFRLMVALPVIFASVGTLCAEPLVATVLGEAYRSSVVFFRPWIWSTVLGFVNMLMFALLYACQDHRTPAWGIGAAVIIDAALNWFCLPRYGAIAAVWIRFAADGVNFLVLSWGVYRQNLWTACAPLVEKPSPC